MRETRDRKAYRGRVIRVAEGRRIGSRLSLAILLVAILHASRVGIAQSAGSSSSALAGEPACQSLTPAAVGGPMPKDASVIVLRWLGTSNHEIAYRDTVVLLDAYYERGPRSRPLGFKREDVKRADAIFIGHGHSDHMADAPYVAEQTRSAVFGGPPTIEHARRLGLPEKQAMVVRGGEVHKFKRFTVRAILAHHAVLRMELLPKFQEAISAAAGELTEAEKKQQETVRARGTSDPRIIKEGTIAYLFSFDNGFRLLWLDSAGPITEGERTVMQEIGRTDVAIVSYQGHSLARDQIAATLPLVELFDPRIFIPTHIDEEGGILVDKATYPLFMAIREALPETRVIDPLYRTPVCINTVTKEVFVGR